MLTINYLMVGMLSLFYLFYLIMINRYAKRGPMEICKRLIMFIYLLLVIKYTVFPIPKLGSGINFLIKEIGFSRINCIPLRSLYWAFAKSYSYSMIMIILKPIIFNILISIPFGFLTLLSNYSIASKSKFWLALGFGLCIEGVQLLISLILGYSYKAIDVDDIIFSAIGILIGYRLYAGYRFVVHSLSSGINQ